MMTTRREFLKGAAVAAAAGFLPGPLLAGSNSSWAHRIVRVHQPLASFFEVINFEFQKAVPETFYGGYVNERLVHDMFDSGICALTGEADPVKAMRRLVPYQAGERVFIKINTTTTYELWKGDWDKIEWDRHYNDTDAIAEPINATVRALTRIGVPEELIGIGDASWSEGDPDSSKRTPRLTPNRVARKIKAVHPKVVLYRSSYMADGNGITWTSNDRQAIVEFRDPVIDRRKQRITSHRVPDQLIGAAHKINLPIMKRHDSAGVTGALKNNFGTIASCAYFHEPRYNGPGKTGAMYHEDNNPTVDIWLNPHVGGKTRLIVCDAIFAGWNWGSNPPTGWKQFGGRSPNCLLLGTDPVAMDSVIFDHVTESLPDKIKEYPAPAMLIDGARVGLGLNEHRGLPKSGYKKIEYVEIEQAADPAKLQKLAGLRERFLKGAKSAREIKDILAEAREAGA
jgi:hypothetical protein